MRTDLPSRRRIRALAFAASGLLSIPACAPDDPIQLTTEREHEWQHASTTYPSPNSGASPDSSADPTPTSAPSFSGSSSTTTTTTTTTLSASSTGQPTEPPETVADSSVDGVPVRVLEDIRSLWPEEEWSRALAVARCESNYRIDAANPTSSARGVFQLLAPWTRDPGSGQTVWGWLYTENGEKLSAAAGLGISEDDARYGYGNIVVAHEIWRHSGWGPWAASESCWRRR